jgi:hypothetical protein
MNRETRFKILVLMFILLITIFFLIMSFLFEISYLFAFISFIIGMLVLLIIELYFRIQHNIDLKLGEINSKSNLETEIQKNFYLSLEQVTKNIEDLKRYLEDK